MKTAPIHPAPATGARVEFEVRFSRGTKGRRPVRAEAAEAAPEVAAEAVPATPVPSERRERAQVAASATLPEPTVTAVTQSTAQEVTSAPSQAGLVAGRVPKLVLLLVLGHHFERLIRDGVVRDYAEIARRTGMTRARVTQITNLMLLAPEIQEAILDLEPAAGGDDPVHERSLRKLVAETRWGRQPGLWSGLQR